MKIGTVTYFNKGKGFGFITIAQLEFYFHISNLNSTPIDKGDIVAFEYEKSKKQKRKYEAFNIDLINNDTVGLFFEKVSGNDLLILIQKFPDSFNGYLDKKASYNYSEFKELAILNINAFDKVQFSNQIKAKISISRNKKPGDDDSFFARIVSEFPESTDLYLKRLNPNFNVETYSDRGFYSCFSMEKDYDRDYRDNDEKKLPEIQETLKTNFLNNYKIDEHLSTLINQFINDYKMEIRKMMLK